VHSGNECRTASTTSKKITRVICDRKELSDVEAPVISKILLYISLCWIRDVQTYGRKTGKLKKGIAHSSMIRFASTGQNGLENQIDAIECI